MAKIHWTVRWCTGLSGEPTAPATTVARAISARHVARSNGRLDAPDSVRCANSPEEQWTVAPDMEGDRTTNMNSSCLVVHRTVRCTTRQKARMAYQIDLQRLLAALGL
jgi:hypothetical protein